MKKFKCTVTKEYEYEIEIDETVWNEENLKNWSEVFTDVEDIEELVKYLATLKPNYANGEFIEGFGIPMINGKEPFIWGREKSEISQDININIITDGEASVECEEIN